MKKNLFAAVFAAAALLSGTVRAEVDAQGAQKFVEKVTSDGIEQIINANVSQAEKDKRFEKLFNSALDLDFIGKFVLGRNWRTATPAQQHPIGRWGRLHKNYLKEQHPIRYNQLVLSGELGSYLAKLDEQAEEQLALIVQQMQEAEGVTEALKAANQMEWVQRMNNIRNRAEEIIWQQLFK